MLTKNEGLFLSVLMSVSNETQSKQLNFNKFNTNLYLKASVNLLN